MTLQQLYMNKDSGHLFVMLHVYGFLFSFARSWPGIYLFIQLPAS